MSSPCAPPAVSGQSWRDDPEYQRVAQLLQQLEHEEPARLACELEDARAAHEQILRGTVQAEVDGLLGRAARAVRGKSAPPSAADAAAPVERAELALAQLPAKVAAIRAEIEPLKLRAKQRRAEELATAAAAVFAEYMPALERAYALHQELEQLASLADGEFPPGTEEGRSGVWSFLPPGSPQPAYSLRARGLRPSDMQTWRNALTDAGYRR